jgi:16S rRNA (adenine1518-N6/adenine1519-N6)-dimethyltransferase
VSHPSAGISPIHIPRLLKKYGLHPNKRLGQNFLVDDAALRRVMEAAGISGGEVVLEVGPGLGSLTRYLAVEARQVIAVELDANLIPPLREVLSSFDNVTIIQGDILQLNPSELVHEPNYLVAANIPYYITSALIRHLLEAAIQPKRIVLTLQKEVATRICASPPEMSLLALSVQVYGNPRIAAKIPAGAFYPPPQVDSAILRIDLYPTPAIPAPYTETFFRLAKAGFAQKRKTLRNALSAGLGWSKDQTEETLQSVEVDPRRRAETLSLEEWEKLSRQVYKTVVP